MSKLFSISRRARMPLSRLLRDRRGATAAVIAVSLTGLAGVGGLATEGASWYFTSRSMQSAADAAAFTGALALAASDGTTNFKNEAKWVASSSYNFTDGTNNTTVTVNSPPASGNHTTDTSAVEVIINQTETPLLSSLFMASGPTITARSVATASINGSGCVLTLDRSNVVDLSLTGNANLNLTNCGIYVNSDDASAALSMTGNASITASSAYIVGGISTTGNAGINTNHNTHTHATPINDPYANVSVPTYSGEPSPPCPSGGDYGTSNGHPYGGSGPLSAQHTVTGSPGITVLCGGISLSGNSSLTLNSGIYVLYGSPGLQLTGNASLTATSGVTLVLTGDSTNGWATATATGNGNVSITAPTSGPTKGLAIFQDRNTPNSNGNGLQLTGNGSLAVTGAIYAPTNNVSFTGNGGANAPNCTQLVAYTATFTGNGNLQNNCSGVGVTQFGNSGASYVE